MAATHANKARRIGRERVPATQAQRKETQREFSESLKRDHRNKRIRDRSAQKKRRR
jgi:hypothetical protein